MGLSGAMACHAVPKRFKGTDGMAGLRCFKNLQTVGEIADKHGG